MSFPLKSLTSHQWGWRHGLWLLCFLGNPGMSAESPGWEQVNALARVGNWQEAIQVLEAHPNDRGENPSYFYSFGTLHYQAGHFGLARAYLEKANRLLPHNTTIQHNLRLARKATSKIIGSERLDPASSWLESIADQIPLDELRGTLGLLALILTLIWTRVYWKSHSLRQTFFQPSGFFCALGFLVTVSLYGICRAAEQTPPLICLERQMVRSGPGDHYLEIHPVEVGTKLRLLDTSSLWYQVRFSRDSAGGVGWVRASSVLVL